VHLSIILVINQLSAQIIFIISLLYASTCFEHYARIIRRSKLYYKAFGTTKLCRWPSRAPVHRKATYRVWRYQMLYNTILTSWWWAQQCSKHVEAYNKLIIKIICALRWLITQKGIKSVNKIHEILWLFFLWWCCIAMTFNTVTYWHGLFRVWPLRV